MEKVEIEKIEYETLKRFNNVFYECIADFNTKLVSSLEYLEYITLPIIISSVEERAYNPFADIIEKYVEFIVIQKMEDHGYKFLPLGYSADMCFDGGESIINIDIKTANLNNPSDFKDTIPLGFNQTSYPAKMPLGERGQSFYLSEGKKPFKVYPVLPVEYQVKGKRQITVTNALLFIYPDYKDIMDKFRSDYEQIITIIDGKLRDSITKLLQSSVISIKSADVEEFLEKKNANSHIKNRRVLYENIIRGYYIHKMVNNIDKIFDLDKEDQEKLKNFFNKLKEIIQKLRDKEIKPVAIISISIPNGMLSPHYDDEIVSGKNYGKSIRYHYGDGKFKLLSTPTEIKSRVVFLDYDKDYLQTLRSYFTKMFVFETKQKELT